MKGFLNFVRRPRFGKSDTARLALLRPTSPPMVSVFGNGGHGVQRAFAPLAPAVALPNRTAIVTSLLGNGNTLAGKTSLDPLSETTTQGALLQSQKAAI